MSDDSSNCSPLETTTHQDHVIKHVVGATVLGWFIAGEAAHLLLDIGFLWTIYLDGEMNLLPQGVAIPELDADEINGADKATLVFDAELLLNEGREAIGLKRFMAARLVFCLGISIPYFGAITIVMLRPSSLASDSILPTSARLAATRSSTALPSSR